LVFDNRNQNLVVPNHWDDFFMTPCQNCQTTFEGKYCPNCAQKADTHRFTLKHFVHDFFHAFTHADKGIFLLMKELFLKPGKVARDFNAGKRKRYFNPITYLLLIMALQIFLSKKTDVFTVYLDRTQKMMQELRQANPEVSPWNSDEALETQKKNNPKVLEHNRMLNLIFLPFLALLTWLFFKRSGFNYAENLVFNVFYMAQTLLFFVIFTIIPFVIFPSGVMLWMMLFSAIYIAYTFLALQQFFKQRWWLTLLKGTAVMVIYFILIDQITNLVVTYL
jgi:Protein of unknown function (DUF3667)